MTPERAHAEAERELLRAEAERDRLRQLIDELLDCTALDDGEQAEWRERAGLPS